MAKKMLIDATHAEETRVVVVDGNKVEEFDFESENKRQLAGNIYLAKVTRVEPSLQAAFVDYGGNRHGFLAFSEIHPDYYQIPVADREALMEEERALAEAQKERDEEEDNPKPARARRSRARKPKQAKPETDDAPKGAAPEAESNDAPEDSAPQSGQISGMETIDLDTSQDTDAETSALVEDKSKPQSANPDAPDDTSGQEPSADDDGDDSDTSGSSGGKTMAANADHGDALATRDPGTGEETEDNGTDGDDDNGNRRGSRRRSDAASKDDTIESVADDDDTDDIRPPRKARPRRYKIQEVIKVRQIMLVQVVKEERGNKGAALTTYLSLAGRYCVLMPNTARGGGISRKITNAVDRKKLKAIASEIDVPKGAGLIVRTAGANRTKAEIKRDYEYLQRLWEQIRELTLQSIAPAKIYEEGDLIKRSIRDLYSRDIDEVLVEGDRGYRIAKDFMKMIMPSHAKNVKKYEGSLPLFARFQVESYLSSMFNPTVQLRSGGYIVIGVTEALVAIDVNSGRATKEGSIEETATKTNLEAAEEVARQLRLRDLAGLIVIDFIDMDERKNNAAVEKMLKDKLKTDRARIQMGRISGFGLLEMSRQRLRPGMIEATTQPCPHCHGTGLIRSDDNLALSILREIEEEGTRRRSREVLVKAPIGIANYLMNHKREHVAMIEARYGLSVRIEGDPMLISPDFSLEKFKTATRTVPEVVPVVSADAALMGQIDDDDNIVEEADVVTEPRPEPEPEQPQAESDDKPRKKRRRRRRSKKKTGNGDQADGNGTDNSSDSTAQSGEAASPDTPDQSGSDAPTPEPSAQKAVAVDSDADTAPEEAGEAAEPAPKKRRTRTRRKPAKADTAPQEVAAPTPEATGADTAAPAKPEPAPDTTPATAAHEAETAPAEAARTVEQPEQTPADSAPSPAEPEQPEQKAPTAPDEPAEAEAEPESATNDSDTTADSKGEVLEKPAAEKKKKPASKRRGWWSLGS
ncbi:RNAse E [Salinihabitans flavidus]|uniref:Ribonuclease E n=1 Tax=Salinihabitans flavidus TaxID=569882 RepID=A0A1H8NHE2_9RHOB|nr:ribonuclease E/G [Salinihabitans flavidus]SEO28899.1 RNAse E [Salinihabitans flavidus]